MVTRLNILITYNCSLRCKHCYVFSDQRAAGKISISHISNLLKEGRKLPGIKWIYFSGGEPFTQYPFLLKAIQRARNLGYEVGVETNGYFARSVEAGVRFLRPLAQMGVEDLRVSNDSLHYKDPHISPAKKTLIAAKELGIPSTLVITNTPDFEGDSPGYVDSYAKTLYKSLMYSGRASELLLGNLPDKSWEAFITCPRIDLPDPEEVFIDAFGYVQICPGIAIGNSWDTPLSEIIENYEMQSHPVLGVLNSDGPAGLMESSGLDLTTRFVDPCHCCYSIRRDLANLYPDWIAPRQVYGY